MLNKDQIKLVQIAVKMAGIRKYAADGRYYLLLGQYRQPSGSPVTSCKQLNNSQLEDLLSICESQGWRMPGKPENFYRIKVVACDGFASFAQQAAIKHLAGDLGWNDYELNGFLERMTNGKVNYLPDLKPREAYKIIEALKAIFNRENNIQCNTLDEIKNETESSRISDKQTECEISALNGLRDGKDDKNGKNQIA